MKRQFNILIQPKIQQWVLVGAAVKFQDTMDRWSSSRCKVDVAIDSHGHSVGVVNMVRNIKEPFRPIIAGNMATRPPEN